MHGFDASVLSVSSCRFGDIGLSKIETDLVRRLHACACRSWLNIYPSHNLMDKTRKSDHSSHFGRFDREMLPSAVKLTNVFPEQNVCVISSSCEKPRIIELLVNVIGRDHSQVRHDSPNIVREILARERRSSSALGRGLAFPHLRTPLVTSCVGAIGVSSQAIDFDSVDALPTKIVFLTLSPQNHYQEFSRLLSKLISLMQDKVVNMQLSRETASCDIYEYLLELDGCEDST